MDIFGGGKMIDYWIGHRSRGAKDSFGEMMMGWIDRIHGILKYTI